IKNEMFYGRDWAGITLEKFICFLDRYIRWYNEKRIKLSLGAMSPVKYRQHLGITT
ncbi:IS3 family transposase, partial [Klebsiella variicola]